VPERISQWLARSRFVDKAVLLALDGVIGPDGKLDRSRTEVYVPNEFVAEAAASHSNLLFGASINPYRADAMERLAWAKEHGAVLVKWIPSIMQIDPSDQRLIPFYRRMVELELPLLSHAGKERSFSSSTDALCDPEKLRLPLDLGVTVIAAHIASTGKYEGQRSSERLARMMPKYPSLYSDISSLTQLNKLRFAREAIDTPEFAGRLVYGSDFPLINTALVSPWYYAFRLSPRKLYAIAKEKNPWDADIELKTALGLMADNLICKKRLKGL
jgi:predicted TIM-barrel fold metal-dependent hydrolase